MTEGQTYGQTEGRRTDFGTKLTFSIFLRKSHYNETKTNTELPQTMGSTLYNRSTTAEPTAALVTWGLNAF